MGIPNLKDRVCQTAAMIVLEPIECRGGDTQGSHGGLPLLEIARAAVKQKSRAI